MAGLRDPSLFFLLKLLMEALASLSLPCKMIAKASVRPRIVKE
jgi:hypothetical protein